jgi:hypothetical protein
MPLRLVVTGARLRIYFGDPEHDEPLKTAGTFDWTDGEAALSSYL